MPGMISDPNSRKTQSGTVPTTDLPADGYTGPIPDLPGWVELDEAGFEFWEWAWRTPQAAAWDSGTVPTVARRAALESAFYRLSQKAPDKVAALTAKMTELDNKLGLSPYALAALHWRIIPSVDGSTTDLEAKRAARRERLA
jgi:hypothetical protein